MPARSRLAAVATRFVDLLPAVAALSDPSEALDLARVGKLVGLSPSRVQRVFSAEIGESPHAYGRAIALDLGALLLVASDERVIDVAFATGFRNHETFSRGFRTRFGESPTQWRHERRGALDGVDTKQLIAASRCLRLHHRPLLRKEHDMTYDIRTETLDQVPILFQNRRVGHDELGTVLAEVLPTVFSYVMEAGLAPAGHPFVRYLSTTPAFFVIDAGIPLVTAPAEAPPAASGIRTGDLPAGLAAVTTHKGPYEELGAAHAALDRWIAASAHEPAGDRWELFLTDPGEVPDPADWLTKVCWPIR